MDNYNTIDKDVIFDYLQNIIIDNFVWFILLFIVWLIFLKIPQSIYISYKLLKWNRWVMWNVIWTNKADIYLQNFWYNHNWLSKTDLNKYYFSPIIQKSLNLRYELIINDYIKYKLIELDIHDNKYKSIRNLKNKIIVFIIQNYLIYIIWDKKSYYLSLKSQLEN